MIESFKIPSATFPTLTDSIVNFNSQYAGLPLKSHSVKVVATQSGSGTPSPSNPRPISGYSAIGVSATGLNLWGGNAVVFGIKSTIPTATEGTDYIEFASNATDNGYFTRGVKFKTNTQYTFIFSIQNPTALRSNMRVMYDDSSYSNIPNVTDNNKQTLVWTSDANKTIVGLVKRNAGGETRLFYDECCLLEGVKTVDDFEPFGTYITIQIGSTVYGGKYDARTGVLTVTYKGVDLGSLTWTYQSQYARFISNVISDISDVPNVRTMDIMCSCYQTIKDGRPLAQVPDYSIYNSGGSKQLNIHDSRYTSGTDLATALSGQYATYLIRPTQTIQLPPCPIDTLLENNIWADTGDTTLQYIKLG